MRRVSLFLLLISWALCAYTQQREAALRTFQDHRAHAFNPCQAPFYHGVASGDPLQDRVILWTRVTRADSFTMSVPVLWQMAPDPFFSSISNSGTAIADTSHDHTLKVDATGLSAGTTYYYRFIALGDTSIVGRTRTAPSGSVSRLRFGVVSCSDLRQGFFTAYQKLAERNDLDAILHLGDYIYEGGGGSAPREHDPDAEIYRLQDYRTRYSQYHLDTALQRCHQMHPFITAWDDHDIVVDALRDTSYRHNAAAFGPYAWRKHAAIRAAREWLPMRDPDSLDVHFFKNWREFHYGDLADIFMLDARLYDRDRFAVDVSDTIYGDADHRIIGPEQMNWINEGLRNSTARWKVLGNQVMLSQFVAAGVPLVLENWDGYPAERNQFYDNLDSSSVSNVVVVTGDFHCSFANDVPRDALSFGDYNPFTGDGSLCSEWVVPSVTGDNFDEGNDFGLGTSNASLAESLVRIGNPHTKYVNLTAHGYVLLDLDASRAQGEFWHMANIDEETNLTESLGAAFFTADGSNHVQAAAGASLPVSGSPIPPPAPCRPVGTDLAQSVLPLSLFPNPCSQRIWLQLSVMVSSTLNLTLVNAHGKWVREFEPLNVMPGHYQVELGLEGLPAGAYTVMLRSSAGESHALQLMILR